MDREQAAALLGVPVGASSRRVEKAFRARVRDAHPDRFPPGSEAWEDANHLLGQLLEARAALGLAPGPAPGATSAQGTAYDAVPSWERSSEGFRSPRDTDRMARVWGYAWGAFLIGSAILSWVLGSAGASNDALPLWSPALAVIGMTALVIGWRADRRLRQE